jgi:hypothetical protein
MGLSAHLCREGGLWLSAQSSLPAQRCRVPYAECFLSVEVTNPVVLAIVVAPPLLYRT